LVKKVKHRGSNTTLMTRLLLCAILLLGRGRIQHDEL
jgi:hypothetical protein